MDLRDFNQFIDKTVLLQMTDGETAKVKVNFVDLEYDDIVVDVLESSHADLYRDKLAAYTFAVRDIASAELAE